MNPSEPRPEDLPPHLRELQEKLARQTAAEAAAGPTEERITEPVGRWLLQTLVLLVGSAAATTYAIERFGLPIDLPPAQLVPISAPLWSIGLVVLILAIVFGRYARLALRQGRIRSAQATGLIVDTQLERSPGSSAGWVYRLVVLYQFQAAGRTITAAYRPSTLFHNMMTRHESNKKKYPAGQVATLYYDPEQPENAGPDRGSATSYRMFMLLYLVGILMLSVGGVVFYIALRGMIGG